MVAVAVSGFLALGGMKILFSSFDDDDDDEGGGMGSRVYKPAFSGAPA